MEPNYETTWNTYASSWSARTAAEKKALLATSLTDDCCYTDPLTTRTGHAALLRYMEEFQTQIPGGHFETKWFLAYGGRSVALWDLCDSAGQKVGEGASFGTYDTAGKLTSMTGFFETPA